MKIRYAPLAVACALMVAASAQAAAVTYYFGGALDTVPDGPSLAVGDTFAGSFTFESTALDFYPTAPSNGTYFGGSFSIEGTVKSYSFSGIEQSATCVTSSCVGVVVFDQPTSLDFFQVTSSVFGGPFALVNGPTVDERLPSFLFFRLSDSSATVFDSDALPSNLALSSFDGGKFDIYFTGGNSNGSQAIASGSLSYLSAAPAIPEASTSAMLALGLGALAVVRRRKAH